jgi:hypothetical protein
VVGHDQKIERSAELDLEACGRRQLLASGKTIGVLGSQPGAKGAGIHRHPSVEMGIAPEDLGREVAARVRRVVLLWFESLFQTFGWRHWILSHGDSGRHQHQTRNNSDKYERTAVHFFTSRNLGLFVTLHRGR